MVSEYHIVLTRFNVRVDDRASPPGDEWLRARLNLFRRFTVPSLQAQTRQPTCWIVLCGPSPSWFMDELARIRATAAPFLRAVISDAVFSPASAAEAVASVISPNFSRVITTRLDNDDAIASDYLEAIQRAAGGLTGGFVNFTHGFQLAHGRLYRRSDPSNAFISRVETKAPLTTVFVDQHQWLRRHGPITQVNESPKWLQVVHGGNVANAAHGIRAHPRELAAWFAVEPGQLEAVSPLRLRVDQARSAVQLAGRVVRRPSRLRWLYRVVMSGRSLG